MSNPVFSVLSFQILFPYTAVALTALVTWFHPSVLKRRLGDNGGMWLYFVLFFLMLLAVPVIVILAVEPRPLLALAGLGLRFGNYKIGLLLMLAGSPIAVFISHLGARRPEIKEWYPFSKDVCSRSTGFIVYEVGYVFLYYTAWEFIYRGLLFFPLLGILGFLPAMAITTALSTLHHIGHPKSEIVYALIGGFLFSVIALFTRSVLYPFAIHAMAGVSIDTFICLRRYRESCGR